VVNRTVEFLVVKDLITGNRVGNRKRLSVSCVREAGYSLKWGSGEEGVALQCRSMSALAEISGQ
jgi:hypothetical protein